MMNSYWNQLEGTFSIRMDEQRWMEAGYGADNKEAALLIILCVTKDLLFVNFFRFLLLPVFTSSVSSRWKR